MKSKISTFKKFMNRFAFVVEIVQLLKFIFLCVGLVIMTRVDAQQKFITEGKIEYERKINVHRQVDEEDMRSEWFKELVKNQQPFYNSNFSLQFSGNKTMYKLTSELPEIQMSWLIGPSKENSVLTDFEHHSRQSVKSVFEQKFLIADSLKNFEWKVSDEMRTIAGMECRKAVGKICDSVYVVAFYTDEIPVSGGPESFFGLPGMILGIAIPRLNTTWFATRIQLEAPSAKDFELPARGSSKTNTEKLRSTLHSSLKDWGKYGEKNTWWVML